MMSKYIFISYAHNDNVDASITDFKNRLVQKLHCEGVEIFFDKDRLKEGDWERKLEANIAKSEWFIFVVSKNSVSYDGFCLNELTMAHENNIKIIPVIFDDSPIPITINRLQRYFLFGNDGIINESSISNVVDELADLIKNGKEVGYFDEDLLLKQSLKPVSCVTEISRHRSGYIGREDLFEKVEEWLNAREEKNRLFLVKAFPGFGKTAFSANCCFRFNQIGAVHFCKFDNAEKANAKRIIASLAYWLGYKLPTYKNELIKVVKINNRLCEDSNHNAKSLFELLFIDILTQIRHDGSPVLMIIDALDEAIWQGHINNELCDLLRMYVEKLPKWIKILVTTRDDSFIISNLMNVSVTYEFTRDVNQKDIKSYFEKQLKNHRLGKVSPDVLELLFEKSEGSFVYAREIINEITKENISLDKIDDFPNGLYELYRSTFDRIFKICGTNYEDMRPLLELVCITPEELTDNFLCQYFNWTDTEMMTRLMTLSSIIRLKGDTVEKNEGLFRDKKVDIIHKTLIDWLTQSDEAGYFYAGEYHISKHDAYVRMLTYMQGRNEMEPKYPEYCLRHYGFVVIQLIVNEIRDNNRLSYIRLLENILLDVGFQKERISRLTLDTAIKMYIEELRCYYKYAGDEIYELYTTHPFIEIFSKYRRYLYNSGSFFSFKEIGFSDFLNSVAPNWDLEGEVGKIFYYYITEDFYRTIYNADGIINSKKYKKELIRNKKLYAELYNVKGLAQRKLVDFDGAINSFNRAIHYAKECNYSFELSLAYLIKSKINIRMNNVYECKENGELAVKYLKNAIAHETNYNVKLDYTLFLAEEYRVLCDNMIWAGDIETAMKFMKYSEDIYSNHVTTDRYYIRSQYTKLFLKIVQHEGYLLDKIETVEAMIKNGKYDVGQINIVKALFLLLNGCDKVKARKAAENAYEAYISINCLFEQEEARCLHNLIVDEMHTGEKIFGNCDNKYINEWIRLYRNYIKNLIATMR